MQLRKSESRPAKVVSTGKLNLLRMVLGRAEFDLENWALKLNRTAPNWTTTRRERNRSEVRPKMNWADKDPIRPFINYRTVTRLLLESITDKGLGYGIAIPTDYMSSFVFPRYMSMPIGITCYFIWLSAGFSSVLS